MVAEQLSNPQYTVPYIEYIIRPLPRSREVMQPRAEPPRARSSCMGGGARSELDVVGKGVLSGEEAED